MATLYQEARAALRAADFRPKKRLGQNFLIHENVIGSILGLLDLSPADEVLEVGPGLGFLTRRLVEKARSVWAVEVDSFLVDWLNGSFLGSCPRLHLIHGDILDVPLRDLLPAHKIKLVANLPYSISTPALFRLFELRDSFSVLVLMVQKEVADRMMGRPGTKSYGALSVWCQVHGRILEKIPVSPEAFFPRPRVRSTILKMGLYSDSLCPEEDLSALRGLVRSAFGQRRKTLANALGSRLQRPKKQIEAVLSEEGIDPKRRGETLHIDEFLRLARALRGCVASS